MEQTKTAAKQTPLDAAEWETHEAQRARAGAIDADRSAERSSDVRPTADAIHLARHALAVAHRSPDREALAALTRAVEQLVRAVEQLTARIPESTK